MSSLVPKSVVLLSAGVDSTVNFYQALKSTKVLAALTLDYGQKAAFNEIQQSKELCEINGIRHIVLDLKWLSQFSSSSLTTEQNEIPTDEVAIDDLSVSAETAKKVWVPNRNGLFLNTAAVVAEQLGADMIVPGFNKEEAVTFADNSKDFIRQMELAFTYSTQNKVKIECYTIDMDKTEIIKLGAELKVPFQKMWPCYFSSKSVDAKWCGKCESCQRAKRAFEANGILDQAHF